MKTKNNKGFTLIEILVTVAILAVMLALSLSIGRSSLQRASFNSAYNQFIADFYYARQLAARDCRYVAIVFDPLGNLYTVREQIEIDADLKDENSYKILKEVKPMGEEAFFTGAVDFAFSSTGLVRAYPVDVYADPISFSITFFKKNDSTGENDFKKTIWIYPSGGIKIEQ